MVEIILKLLLTSASDILCRHLLYSSKLENLIIRMTSAGGLEEPGLAWTEVKTLEDFVQALIRASKPESVNCAL